MRLSPTEILFTAAAAITLGIAGGAVTANGMEAKRWTGDPSYPPAATRPAPIMADAAEDGAPRVHPAGGMIAADCTGCSDYQAGRRWARLGAIAEPADCIADSWSFQRGCLAYVRERGRSST